MPEHRGHRLVGTDPGGRPVALAGAQRLGGRSDLRPLGAAA
ncbi:hypothetical protein N7925_32060 [Streptomyces sp. CA-278952]|nr:MULTISPECIES: hypothetical protein [unclassified Streptomyces]UZI32703.1 hypothetical protein OH133_34025 [Streptomyces sp. VB1]WDG32634.1 hypothetical protein N7925_32060 [Streptomyces sp. CA-278952]